MRVDQPCSHGVPVPRGAPSALPLSVPGPACLQVLPGEWFGRAGGVLSCFRHELGEDAFFPRVEGGAVRVSAVPLAVVYLQSTAGRAMHTCSAPCAAPASCPKPHLQGCVGIFSALCRVFGLSPETIIFLVGLAGH